MYNFDKEKRDKGAKMKVKILGSGGGESFPASFCSCAHCEQARKAGGKSLRTLSQTLIGDDLLIDFPSDTDSHCLRYGLNLGKIENVLITHAHLDHFLPTAVNYRGGFGAHNMPCEKIYFYGPTNLEKMFDAVHSVYGIAASVRENVCFVALEDKKPVQIGAYTVTALTAAHAPQLGSLNYVIERDGKSLLYLLDSGYPTEETLAYLERRKQVFDCVIMDATMGVAPAKTYIYHMGFEEDKALKEELLQRKIADKHTKFIATHFTHNKAETHDKIEAIFAGTDIVTAYDGYETEI